MTGLLSKAFEITKKQWQLLLLTVVTTILFQLDYGIGDENFGFVILIAVPYLFWAIFTFCLTKLIHQKIEHPQTSLKSLLKIYLDYAPKLILPMIGLMLLIFAIMTILITMVYGVFSIFGITNQKSIFESGPQDLNYILFYLFFNCAMAFFSFQGVLYFLKNQSFFGALKNSVTLAKKHLPFTLSIGIAYFTTMTIGSLIGSDAWYKNVLIGTINGVQYYYVAALLLLFYQKIDKH